MEDRSGFEDCICCEREQICCRVLQELECLGRGNLRVSKDFVFRVDVGEEPWDVPVDLLVFDGARPVLLVECIAGHLALRERVALAKARLLPGGPVPLAMVANDRDLVVVEVEKGKEIGFGLDALTRVVQEGFAQWKTPPKPSLEGTEREKRVLATYGNLACGGGSRDRS